MKILTMTALAITFSTAGFYLSAQTAKLSSAGVGEAKHLFLDVHRLTPGIKPEAVAQAHQKDLLGSSITMVYSCSPKAGSR